MTYQPHIPNGSNATLNSSISATGEPIYGKTYRIPARCGIAVSVKDGDLIKIDNPSGYQVCDFWAFRTGNLNEYLSMSHSRTHLKKLIPEIGDTLVSNLRNHMVTIEDSDTPISHDTLIAACDHHRYQQLGVQGYHDNCTDNLRMATQVIGHEIPLVPDPFNLWMNVPISTSNDLSFEPPISGENSSVLLRIHGDCLLAMSACPQDVTPVNGDGKNPSYLEFCVSN
ncbi:urea carboxylase-associated family protein [uncultured Pseudoteredinibacter sp.]|uniref:urea carboxylase-associated family protein n=1 Tax=uncultured Pseudoteredinibacter sp. TaxID=1641701 RepID=UPI0026026801|nr:urea carboxylase-associated family protein [uncultured Pseudoteredinibacter sp.]